MVALNDALAKLHELAGLCKAAPGEYMVAIIGGGQPQGDAARAFYDAAHHFPYLDVQGLLCRLADEADELREDLAKSKAGKKDAEDSILQAEAALTATIHRLGIPTGCEFVKEH